MPFLRPIEVTQVTTTGDGYHGLPRTCTGPLRKKLKPPFSWKKIPLPSYLCHALAIRLLNSKQLPRKATSNSPKIIPANG